MSTRERLPRLSGDRLYITDGGLETSLIFDRGLDLPCFAAFVLLADEDGRAALRDYFEPYLAIARAQEVGFVLDTATWRANPDWGAQLGYTPEALDEANRAAVAFAEELRAGAESDTTPIVDLRCHRAARRRLRPGRDDERRGGPRLPRPAGLDLRRQRGRSGLRRHAHLSG